MREILINAVLTAALAAPLVFPGSMRSIKECDARYPVSDDTVQGNKHRRELITACLEGGPTTTAAQPSKALSARPATKDPEEDRRLKRDMNICIGC